MKVSFLAGALLCCTPCFSADRPFPWGELAFSVPATEIVSAAAEVPIEESDGIVILLRDEHLALDSANRLTYTIRMIYRVDSARAVQGAGVVSQLWQPWRQNKPQIRARVVAPDGREHMLRQDTLVEQPARNDIPLVYANNRVIYGPLPAVAVGAIVEFESVVEDLKPFFDIGISHRIILEQPTRVMRTRVKLETPKEIPLRFAVRRLPKAQIEDVARSGNRIVTVTHGPIAALKRVEPNLPADVAALAQIEFSTAPSWQVVAREYSRAVEPKVREDEVRELLSSEPATGDRLEAIEPLLARLHREIRYTSLPFGESQLIPQTPAETLQRRFGDCKDKSAVLIAMLRASGIPAYFALIAAGDGQDVAVELPGMGVFNHAIVYVPPAGSQPAVWIDATAKYVRAGHLPPYSAGRYALVVREDTRTLVRTPALEPANNEIIEQREVFLAEQGNAEIVTSLRARGVTESQLRALFELAGPSNTPDILKQHAEDTYDAKYINSHAVTAVDDLSQPFFEMRYEIDNNDIGTTGNETASVTISADDVFGHLPWYFTASDDDLNPTDAGSAAGGERTLREADVVFTPHVSELVYRIVPPPGFEPIALPTEEQHAIGPARLINRFVVDEHGVVTATFRLDTIRGRYTAAEAEASRAALVALQSAEEPVLKFKHAARIRIESGDFKGGMEVYDKLIVAHPDEPWNRTRKARALLSVGSAERARIEAYKAAELYPNSLEAWRALGWVLQHDLLGRRVHEGFDHAGAIAAYRRARALDPSDKNVMHNLVYLLEHDAAGNHFGPQARLEEAMAEYDSWLKSAGDRRDKALDSIVLTHFYTSRFEAALAAAEALIKRSPDYRPFLIASAAVTSSPQRAIERAGGMIEDRQERSKLLYMAANVLQRVRRYNEAAELMAAVGALSPEARHYFSDMAGHLRNARDFKQVMAPADDPRRVVQEAILIKCTAAEFDDEKAVALLSRRLLGAGEHVSQTAADIVTNLLHPNQPRRCNPRGFPGYENADIIFAATTYGVEGSEEDGYLVKARIYGADTLWFFVIREAQGYRLLATQSDLWPLGLLVLELVEAGQTALARRWLDRALETAQESASAQASEDPPIKWFWDPTAPKPDIDDMKLAAAALLTEGPHPEKALEILEAGLKRTQNATQKTDIRFALLKAYKTLELWERLEEVASVLYSELPRSEPAIDALYAAHLARGQWEKLRALAGDLRERSNDNRRAMDVLARVEAEQGRLEAIRDHFRSPTGKVDLEAFAKWASLVPPAEEEVIEAARGSYASAGSDNYEAAHALVCLYAVAGRPDDARRTLLEALERANPSEVDASVWYAAGLVAEAYGDIESARMNFRRALELPERKHSWISNRTLARQRLDALGASGNE